MTTPLFQATRRPPRRAPLLTAIASWVFIYAALAIFAMIAFDEGHPRLSWILVFLAGLELLVPVSMVVWAVVPRARCAGCGASMGVRHIRFVPTYVEEGRVYVLSPGCPACWPGMFDAMASELFRYLDPRKRQDPFLELLRRSEVEVPATEDWRISVAWLHGFVHELRRVLERGARSSRSRN